MENSNIDSLVSEYREKTPPTLIPRDEIIRDIPQPKRFNLVEIITGMRRSGKTYYLFQKIRELIESGFPPERIFYFNFADDRLQPLSHFVMDDVLNAYWRQVPHVRDEGAYLFFDEVQEIEHWQGFCQRVSENENVTLVITGSSSKLTSDEIATTFRGRSHSHEMLPLSFSEFCRFHSMDKEVLTQNVFSSRAQTELEGLFDRYLCEGGFPGIQNRIEEDRIEILQSYVRDVVARDVAERYGRDDIRLANQFALYGLRNSACELSLNSLVDTLKGQGFKIYWEKADKLMKLLNQAYLLFEMQEYSTSLKANTTSPSKIYAVDPGISFAVSRANQQDISKRLETAVYLELRRRISGRRAETLTSFTVPNTQGHKIDFLLGDAMDPHPYQAIQVSADLSNDKTRKREITSLSQAMEATGLREGLILTLREECIEDTSTGKIEIMPVWKWCLSS